MVTDRVEVLQACNPLSVRQLLVDAIPTNIQNSRDERSKHMRWQSSENNDDITALQYHSNGMYLLSGGDDGLVSVFNTNIQEDNDSLLRAFNHGPIHKAGFISDASESPIYALSSDQQFSIYPADGLELDDSEVIQPAIFGDLRPKLQCDYVIDILRGIGQPYVVTGSHLTYECEICFSSFLLR
jgi:WD40 repeat protein